MPARSSRPLALVAAAPAVARAARRAPRRGLQGPARDHIIAAPPPRCGPGRMEGCRRAVRGCRNGRPGGPRRSIRGDPPSANPAVAAGFSGMAAVGLVDYAAARLGCDAEECIQKALGDGEIGMCGRSGGGGGGGTTSTASRPGPGRPTITSGTCSGNRREGAAGGGARVRGGGGRRDGRERRRARLSAAGRAANGGGGRRRFLTRACGGSAGARAPKGGRRLPS